MRVLLVCAILAMPSAAFAAFSDPTPQEDLARIKAQIEAGEPAAALKELRPLLKQDAFEADVFNLMGYAYRKLGDFEQSRIHYSRALSLDPKHKGALEYMGELELQVGDEAAAQALLKRLKDACPDGCEELDDLLEAFGEFERLGKDKD
jgi:Flp pilus assembly protein TadD